MVNNQEKIQEIEEKIKKYLAEVWTSGKLLAYQVDFLDGYVSRWERSNSREEKLELIKNILESSQGQLEHTSFPPYCPTELQDLFQEWLIIHLEIEFQAQAQQVGLQVKNE